jgi:erythromycin esterase
MLNSILIFTENKANASMRKRLFLLLLLFPLFPALSLAQRTVEIRSLDSEDFSDLEPLKEKLEGVRVIGLGESCHGIGEYYRLKSRLVRFLHEEMDFEVLAMEGGLGDINWAWLRQEYMSAITLRDKTVFGNFRCDEINPLFEYLKEQSTSEKPLHLAGYDCQASSHYFQEKIETILFKYDTSLAAYWMEGMDQYYQLIPNLQDSIALARALELQHSAIDTVRQFLEQYQTQVSRDFELSHFEWLLIQRTLDHLEKQLDVDWYNFDWSSSLALRDSLMYENLRWLMDKVYPDKKFIIWAHNGHVEKGPAEGGNVRWMGHYLKDSLGLDYYSIGLFAYEGALSLHWNHEIYEFKNEGEGKIEQKLLPDLSPANFLDLRNLNIHKQWVMRPVEGLEPENGWQVPFIPMKRFDGIIVVREANAPGYEK